MKKSSATTLLRAADGCRNVRIALEGDGKMVREKVLLAEELKLAAAR